jgi:MerR family mercuric resistance operon transcriptional regulator
LTASIGEVSRLTGVNIETVRYYERIGMLAAPKRTEGGRRIYRDTDRRILIFVRRGRELGFTLDEIRTLLGLRAPGKATCAEVNEVARAHLEDIRTKLADLRRLEAILEDAVVECDKGVAPSCPMLEVLEAR